jgi:hypothetical protein
MVCTVCGEDLAVERTSTRKPEQQPGEPAPKRRSTDRELDDQLKAIKKRMEK